MDLTLQVLNRDRSGGQLADAGTVVGVYSTAELTEPVSPDARLGFIRVPDAADQDWGYLRGSSEDVDELGNVIPAVTYRVQLDAGQLAALAQDGQIAIAAADFAVTQL